MFTNILVPLDGSPLAESALPYARSLASKTGAKLTLVRAAATVVMATHGRTGLLRSMLGSIAGAVVHCGNTPVVLVHAARVPVSV